MTEGSGIDALRAAVVAAEAKASEAEAKALAAETKALKAEALAANEAALVSDAEAEIAFLNPLLGRPLRRLSKGTPPGLSVIALKRLADGGKRRLRSTALALNYGIPWESQEFYLRTVQDRS